MKQESLLSFFILLTSCLVCTTSYAAPTSELTTEKIANGVVTAIEDEVYASNDQHAFADVGQEIHKNVFRVPVYIQPKMKNGLAWIIYKFMPYGEVYRMFYVKHGLVILHGDPRNGFPPTQPDYLTVYMSDEQLCTFIHTWKKKYFIINSSPGRQRIDLAKTRQKMRLDSDH